MILPNGELTQRLLGLNQIVYTKCEQPAHFYFHDNLKWQQITAPFVLLAFYWFVAVEFSYYKYSLQIDTTKSSVSNDEASSTNDDLYPNTNKTKVNQKIKHFICLIQNLIIFVNNFEETSSK
jgi:hypothetical protein